MKREKYFDARRLFCLADDFGQVMSPEGVASNSERRMKVPIRPTPEPKSA
jgi:hypothetical protein